MRKSTPVLLFVLILFFPIIFIGCTGGQAGNANKDTTQSALTLDEIKERYTDTNIKNIQNIGEEYLLVESQKDTFANKFDLYNLKTGDADTLPTMPYFVTLEKIENENYFVFLSSGENSESPMGTFPCLIKCIRIKTDLNETDDFIALFEEKYFDLEDVVQSGIKQECIMSDLNITFEGLEVLFKPIEGKEALFYAAITDIPPTKTSYDKDKKQMTFEIGTNHLGEGLKGMKKVNIDDHQFISSYEIKQKDNKIYFIVGLKDLAKKYTIDMKRLPDGQLPYFFVKFK
jgi:hypothetical protein